MGYGADGLELPSLPPLVGRKFGHVRIDSLIDRGGMGEVYKGFDEALERLVAVKAIRPEQRPSADARERFHREARLLSKLEHPNVCQIHDLHQDDGEAGDLLILEFVQGRKLGEVLKQGLGFEQKLRIAEQIASALEAAHALRIVHRDLKPGNVMVTKQGRVKVLDFGLARSLDQNAGEVDSSAGRVALSETGLSKLDVSLDGHTNQKFMVGTLAFMSPEQAVGERLTEASDMYAFGLLLQWLFTEKSPFGDDTSKLDLLRRVLQGDTEAPKTEDAHLSLLIEELKRVSPRRRPTAGECLERLQGIAGKPARRRIRRTLWTAVGLVTLLAGGIFWVTQHLASRRAELTLAYTQEAKDIEWLMRIGHSLPEQELTHHTADVRRRMGSMRGLMQENSGMAAGPGYFALGRGHLALGEIHKAEQSLAAAWEAPYRRPEVGFAYAMVRAKSWEDARAESSIVGDPGWAQYRDAWMDRRFRQSTLDYLQVATGFGGGVPALTEALIALFEYRWEDSEDGLMRVLDRFPWLYEVSAWLAELHLHHGLEAAADGRPVDARDAFMRSADYFRQALNVGSSDARLHLSHCRLWNHALALQVTDRLGPEMPVWTVDEIHQRSSGACERALRVDPQLAAARLELARGFGLRALDAERKGYPADAMEWIDQGMREAPDSSVEGIEAASLRWQSWANGRMARWRSQSGLDAIQSLHAAVEQAQKASRAEPDDPAGIWLQVAGLRALAEHQDSVGEDVQTAQRQLEAVLKGAVNREWVFPQAYLDLARLYLDRATYEARQGLAVEDALALAESSLLKARNQDPESPLIEPVARRLESLTERLAPAEEVR